MTAGESHGPALIATIEGLPSGLHVTTEDLRRGLARRRLGLQRLVLRRASLACGLHFHERRLNLTQSLAE